VLAEDGDEQEKLPTRARKVFVPVSVIEAVKTRFGLPSFCEARKSSATGWERLHDLLTKDEEVGKELKLETELAKLREERDLLKLRSVESTILRKANFEAEFGIDKETFDWVLSIVEKDLPGSANGKIPPFSRPVEKLDVLEFLELPQKKFLVDSQQSELD
jgi:hypothetical protein